MVEQLHSNGLAAMTNTPSLIDELERALSAGTNAQRITMLSRITDLFVEGASRYSAGQINLFDEVIVKLVTAIEAKARAKLSSRLAPVHNAPPGVIRMLAFDDDIEVARPVLTMSERLARPTSSPMLDARASSTSLPSPSAGR